MVEDMTKKGYRCPYCNKFFEDYNLALSCTEDCADIDSPTEDTIIQFKCEMCFHIFEEAEDAKSCEIVHTTNNDFYYEAYLEKKVREKLLIAGNHPNQKKLR